ncbi:MAG: response regulator transcription factor [Coriobacteriales bacterium]|jgi:DNA-binding response OmpR family regulator|nr:response regulator transcription factor [Coriobacteriales bacterium]
MDTDTYKVLICDDDGDIVSALRIYLEGEGYETCAAANGVEAVDAVRSQSVHLVLLDVMMPVMDGILASIKIREFSNVPIIFLSAKGEEADRVLGLHVGADDYIVKPFAPMELFARVKSALRRYAQLGGMKAPDEEGLYQTGGLVLDDKKKSVVVDGTAISLTALEFNILKLLLSCPEQVFSSEQIYEAVWQEPAFDVSRTVSVHIRHIREKIEANPKEPRYIKMVYGLGYKAAALP